MIEKKGYNDLTFGDIDKLQDDICKFATQGARLGLGLMGVEPSQVSTLFDRSEDLPLEPPYQHHSHKRLWFKIFIDIPK